MKTLKMKILLPIMFASFGAFVWAGMKVKPAMNSGRFATERADIRKDLANTEVAKASIVNWKEERRDDRSAGLKAEVSVDKKEIAKARADRTHAASYLMADKKDLARDYRIEVKEQKAAKKEACADLHAAKAELRKDIRKDDGTEIGRDAATVALLIKSHDQKVAALNDLKSDRNGDWFAVKQEIKDSRQESSENHFAAR